MAKTPEIHEHMDHDHDHDHGDHDPADDRDHSPGHEHDDHDHSHSGLHSHKHHAPSAILRAMGITLLFMFIEAAGGWFANSLALLSDAAHMLTDVGAMSLSLFAIWVSRRPSNNKMTFGYHRAEILGALASGLIIWLLAGMLVYEAILRLQNPQDVQGSVVFVVATIGLVANLVCMRMLHGAQHSNMNAKAAYLHMLSDALGSVGAIIAGVILYFTHWRPIDPIVTIFFSLLMLVSSWQLVKEAVGILMESTPESINSDDVKIDLQKLATVREAHDLHIWTVSSGRLALSVHLISDGTAHEVLTAATAMLEEKYKIIHTTIQIEHPESFQSRRCYDCASDQH
jgi:cobalt-zinc-cadmium efflux system protein